MKEDVVCHFEGGIVMNLRHFSTMLVRCLTVTFFVFVFLIIFWVRPVSADSTAFVRVIHASPDIGTADVFVDGSKLLSSFQFGAVTDYVQVPTGPHKVQIALIGKGIG